MPILGDFGLVRYEDGTLTIPLTPPAAVGGWSLRFLVQKRFGGLSGLILRSCTSGYGGGQSGVTIVNSGQGIFSIAINSADTSGLEYGNYAATVERLDSGSRSVLMEGYFSLGPGGIA